MLIPSVRKIHNINSSKVIGLFCSRKMAGQLPFESTLERDWLLWLEYRRDVQAYVCQPRTFPFTEYGRYRRYTPDVEVVFTDGQIAYFEVKPADVCESPRFQHRIQYCAAIVERQGFDFQVVTEADIRIEPQLTNLKRLSAYTPEPELTSSERKVLYGAMDRLGTASINTVLRVCAEAGMPFGLETIFRELFCGNLQFNLEERLSPLSLISSREVSHAA